MGEKMTEPTDVILSAATREQLAKALIEKGVTEEWLAEAFDLELETDHYWGDNELELSPEHESAIRDAYEIVARRASLTHVREFHEAMRDVVNLNLPETAMRLAR